MQIREQKRWNREQRRVKDDNVEIFLKRFNVEKEKENGVKVGKVIYWRRRNEIKERCKRIKGELLIYKGDVNVKD